MSAGGIFGRVVAMDGDSVDVEVAPGVVMTFLRRAISARPQSATPPPAPPEPPDEPWTVEPGGDSPPGDEPPAGPGSRLD